MYLRTKMVISNHKLIVKYWLLFKKVSLQENLKKKKDNANQDQTSRSVQTDLDSHGLQRGHLVALIYENIEIKWRNCS